MTLNIRLLPTTKAKSNLLALAGSDSSASFVFLFVHSLHGRRQRGGKTEKNERVPFDPFPLLLRPATPWSNSRECRRTCPRRSRLCYQKEPPKSFRMKFKCRNYLNMWCMARSNSKCERLLLKATTRSNRIWDPNHSYFIRNRRMEYFYPLAN